MSLSTITRASNDTDLRARVDAAANQQARTNANLENTWFAKALVNGTTNASVLYWAVAVATENAYASAVAAGRGAPGYDTDIITDPAITAAVIAGWPPDPVVA